MRIATFATSVWLTLLGTMALAQSVTYDYDRAASFSNYKTYALTRGTDVTDELKSQLKNMKNELRRFDSGNR